MAAKILVKTLVQGCGNIGQTIAFAMPNSRQTTSPAPTITDIARAAGVNPATVSRALRGVSGKVSPQRRAEIEKLATEMGYQPNALAASLRTRQSNLAAIVVPDLGNPLFGPLVQGIVRNLREKAILCLIAQTPTDPKEREDLVVTLAGRQVSGLLILAAESDDPMLAVARQRDLPTVLVNRGSGDRNFSTVVNDDRESVRLVLEHLVTLGHQCIGHIAGPGTSSTGRVRRSAFVQMARDMNIEAAPVVEAASYTRDAGRTAAEELLLGSPRPTAIFAANDLLALGVLDAMRTRQLSVPADVSLVGHNDMPLMDLVDPPLTTVHIAVQEMSDQAAALFMERIEAPNAATTTRMLMPTLVVRSSTAAPPKR